jgi:dihydroorotase
VPGFIELHAHLREPGFTESETIATGLAAAAIGGYTAVFCMANTKPANDDPAVTRLMLERAEASPVRLYPVTAATRGLGGEELVDYAAQREAGAGAVSDDGIPVLDDDVMRRAMIAAAEVGLPIMDHATHHPAPGGGVLHDGPRARELGLPGLVREEEDDLIHRNVRLAEETGCPVHISHISTAGGVAAVREARARGLPVTAEAAPHHLVLTDADVTGPDHKMNPPLREAADREAVLAALVDGTIAAVATDHAPHAPEKKARGIPTAPFGVIGMESAFPVLYTDLVLGGAMPLDELVHRFTDGPAGIGRIPGGRLADGEQAEVNLLDLAEEFLFDESCLRSRSRNCPFLGRRLTGRTVATVTGTVVSVHRPERFRSRKA